MNGDGGNGNAVNAWSHVLAIEEGRGRNDGRMEVAIMAAVQGRGARLAGGASAWGWWWMGVRWAGDHAVVSGEVTDGSGHSWWWWRLTAGNVMASHDGDGPRGPKPIN